uniref:Helicase SKI2W n=1 Tax=Meloidogyne hapla TaxID=6305 RepID=A0A1I8BR64_MELHA
MSEYSHAKKLDVTKNVEKFKEIKENMAMQYPFELDPFQQHAVCKMEEGQSVFVAAHTSAGKTVVAEYAVALCKKNRTRVIYTSPIKALSNQKFRDFKLTFGDVGLITGDIQLNTEANCLIMTTEILRSMLYNGSEVIKELEWVIFDEVHYINDIERGHVWEEVLIMLPRYVKIVMLSYQKAVQAKDKAQKAVRPGMGVGPVGHPWQMNKNNKNVYINLISYLNTHELLPMIVFIFSRQRCDETAQLLHSVDLTTESEKYAIHNFFYRCIDRLTGSDKELPQVLLMQELCKRGFAVHHSGILPIIKEVVELLFQKGLVKILFATETFAMGVNMPARTVVFDSIEKHDGKERRILNSTEYVQMAGRAGRRGLDTTGTVIILAKGSEPPEISSLTTILKGKPVKLSSQFRITYSMMLNLLRVEHLRIEDMLSNSYVESASLRMVVQRKERLKKIEEDIIALPKLECLHCNPPSNGKTDTTLLGYFNSLLNYYKTTKELWSLLILKGKEAKLFTTGRVLIIHYPPLGIAGRLAVILRSIIENGKLSLTLFIPTTVNSVVNDTKQKVFNALTKEEKRWQTENGLLEHALLHGIDGLDVKSFSEYTPYIILDTTLDCLLCVCKRTIPKIDYEAISQEYLRSLQPSKRSNSPDRNVRKIIQELNQLSEKIVKNLEKEEENKNNDEFVHILGMDLDKKELSLVERLRVVLYQRNELSNANVFPCIKCPDIIEEHMNLVINKRQMEELKQILVHQTSSHSMSEESAGRLKVLRTLNYIDRQNMVLLKGKVACEISNQELLISELILDNKFQDRTPPEIAAMFSAFTCQHSGRNNFNNNRRNNNYNNKSPRNASTSEASLSNESQQKYEQIERVPNEILRELESDLIEAASNIDQVQKACGVVNSPVIEELKFGLMEVVYQWANGLEFAKIMQLTDAQEGIIVRCIQRLDEVCKDVKKAAMIVGSPELAEKMEETSNAIRRDIVFAASLYVTEAESNE